MDKLSEQLRTNLMRRIRSKDTSPEIKIRKLIHSMGYRYRLHAKELPGKPDIAFRPKNKVIFVHGCFWHQHKGCKDNHIPKSNVDYWAPKLEKTIKRDAMNKRKLKRDGWDVLTIWECEVEKKLLSTKKRILGFLT